MKKKSVLTILLAIFFSIIFSVSSILLVLNKKEKVSLPLKIDIYLSLTDTVSKDVFESSKEMKNRFGEDIEINYYITNNTGQGYIALIALKAAEKQEKRIEYLSLLYKNQFEFEKNDLIQNAKDSDLNIDEFNKDRISQPILDSVDNEIKQSQSLGITTTPVIYIDNKKIVVETKDDFEKAVINKINNAK